MPDTSDGFVVLDDDYRFRLYAVRGGARRVVAYADEPSGIGAALVWCASEWEGASFGLLDTKEHTWIVNPFPRVRP